MDMSNLLILVLLLLSMVKRDNWIFVAHLTTLLLKYLQEHTVMNVMFGHWVWLFTNYWLVRCLLMDLIKERYSERLRRDILRCLQDWVQTVRILFKKWSLLTQNKGYLHTMVFIIHGSTLLERILSNPCQWKSNKKWIKKFFKECSPIEDNPNLRELQSMFL